MSNYSRNNTEQACDRLYIGIVSETYPPEVNGVALTLERMVRALLIRGHQVQLVRPHQAVVPGIDGQRIDDQPEIVSVRGFRLPMYRSLQLGMPAGGRLRRVWMQQRPDVVHIATEGPLGQSALRAARRLNIPVTSGFHTNFHSYSRYYRLGFLHNCIVAYLRRFHNRCAGTLVPTRELREQLEQWQFRNVRVWTRGIDTQLFAPSKRNVELRRCWGLHDGDPAFLYVGRLAREKNLPLAIAAFQALQQEQPGARFIVVGDGPMAASLRQQYPDFFFCGVQRGEQLAEHYASADAFLLPSMTETFGNIVLEAMASGLALVCFDYAAGRQHVDSGRNGLLVPLGDETAFISAAVSLARQPARRTELGAAARAAVLACDWEQVMMDLETLLIEVAVKRSLSDDDTKSACPEPPTAERTRSGAVHML